MRFNGAYIKSLVVNIKIFIYIFAIIRIQFNWLTKQTDWRFSEEGAYENLSASNLSEEAIQCLNLESNISKVLNLYQQRSVELTVFFAHIASILIYNIFC